MKKIMFNDRYGLTQAVIEGRKTMTRRMISGNPLLPEDRIEEASICPDGFVSIIANGGESLIEVKYSYKVGEIVAVAQNYSSFYNILDNTRPIPEGAGWNNKMFVRADLMPHQIRITGIKCERLQDISDADCLKEGIFVNEYFGNGKKCHHYGFDGFSMEPKDGLPEDGSTLPAKPSPSLSTRFPEKVHGNRIRGSWHTSLSW